MRWIILLLIFVFVSAENNLTAKCGVFADVFQVRSPCNGVGGKIIINNAGQTLDGSNNIIVNTQGNYLNACQVQTESWVKSLYNTCGKKGDCVATGMPGADLNITYYNPPQLANVDTSYNNSMIDVNILQSDSVKDLYGKEYDVIKPINDGIVNYKVNFHVLSSLSVNKINSTINDKFFFSSSNSNPYDVKIVDFKIQSNGAWNTFATDDNLKNIEIGYFELANDANISIVASESIKMNEFYVGKHSNVVLKAPYVNIDHFEPTESGWGTTIIDIYADKIDMNYIKLPQTTVLRIHPYTPGNRILMRVNDLIESSSSTILLSSGDYYINKSWILPSTSGESPSISAIDENQEVNIFVNNDLTIGTGQAINSISSRGNFGNNPSINFKIFVNGDLVVDGGGTTINATLYVEKNITLGNPTYVRGAMSAGENIEIGQGQFIFDQNITARGWGACDNVVNKPVTGVFDSWDIFRNISDRNISTKIVNKPFTLTLASLNSENNAEEKKNIGDIDVAIFDMNTGNQISDTVIFDTNQSGETNKSIVVYSASKDARVGFKLCSDYNATSKTYTLYTYDHCSGDVVACDVEGLHFRRCFSTDNFAIRPANFTIASFPKIIRAGEVFNFNVTTNSKGYNAIVNVDINLTKNCIAKRADFNLSFITFKDGDSNNTAKFNDVGVAEINITDKEWAKVDEKDTPNSCDENGTYICLDKPITIKIIPHHFELNVNYNNFNYSNFTYISNDLNMSSFLEMNVTAKNLDNKITKNYNSKCYAKELNISISHSIPNKVVYILYKDENGKEHNVSSDSVLSLNNLSSNYFSSENNGSAIFKIYINFEKNYSSPVEEFNFTINDINVTDEDNVKGEKTVIQNATFRYGRIEINDIIGLNNEANTTVSYKYWTKDGWRVNKSHNSSIYGDLLDYLPKNYIEWKKGKIVNGKENIEFITTHSIPYSIKLHYKIPSYLWYHPLAKAYKAPSLTNLNCLTHPCSVISFRRDSIGWGGVGNDNNKYSENKRVADINSTKNIIKANKKDVTKINW